MTRDKREKSMNMIFDQGHQAPYSFEYFLLEKMSNKDERRKQEQKRKKKIIVVILYISNMWYKTKNRFD
jgi:hypothetical protein